MSGIYDNIKGVFFDLYGTLLIYGDMAAAWDEWLGEFHRQMTAAGLEMPGDEFSLSCNGFFSGNDPPPLDGLTPFEIRIRNFAEKYGLHPSNFRLKEIAEKTVRVWQDYVSVDPEAVEVLQVIKRDKKTALISNFDHPPHVNHLLDRYSLSDLLDAVVVSGAYGVKKPDQRIFRIALEQTDLNPQEVMFVGDAEVDMTGSGEAGLIPVLIIRPGQEDKHLEARDYSSGVDDKEWSVTRELKGVKVVESLHELLIL